MRLRRVEVLLLAIAVPVWGVLLALELLQVAAGRPTVWPPLLSLDAVPDASGHPVVRWVHPGWEGGRVLVAGDALLRVGPHDLAGVAVPGFGARVLDQARSGLPVPLTVRRGGSVLEVGLDVRRRHALGVAPIWATLTTVACVAIGLLLVLRAPEARAALPLSLALTWSQLYFGSFFPGPPVQTYAVILSRALGAILTAPCLLQAMLLLVPETAPRSFLGLWWPWLLAPLTASLHTSVLFDRPLPIDVTLRWLDPLVWGVFELGILVVLARSLRRAGPVGRRRIKWVAFGCSLLYAPRALQSVLALFGHADSLAIMPFALGGMVLPACLAIAVVRANLFDIDRLISNTASYTILAIVGLGTVLAGFPRVAAVASSRLGIDPGAAQLVFGLALAGVIVPAQRRLRPQVDRLFFAERDALERGVADLLQDLSDCADPEALFTRTGERLDALVRPESCAVYARTGDVFVPTFALGPIVAAALDPTGPLVAAVARRTAPWVTDGETPGVAVVLPVRGRDQLVAFVCLGAKRSGDIYTATDLTLLGAVARKVSDELVRFDLTDTVARGRVMEESLRQYVPVAVTSQLASGQRIEPAECEVSVLFVDIRGYTTFA